ncbi:hypothetical protein ABPG77_010569 [Micractinium sp. CCAP 211/92]
MTTLASLTEPSAARGRRPAPFQPRRQVVWRQSKRAQPRNAAQREEAGVAPPAPPLLPLLPLRPSPLPGSQQRVSPNHYSSSSSSLSETWRRAAAAGAAALLAAQALVLSPLEASAAGSPALATSPAEQQQQQQQRAQAAAAVSAAPGLLGQDPAAVVAGLPPLPTEFPQLPPLALPKYQQITLKNGLRVFLLEDHELPVVRGSLLMRGGTRASPDDKVGLATLSAAVQRSGGSEQHPGQALDDKLEELGASIEGGAGAEAFGFGFQCLREDTAEVLSLFAEVVRTPAIPQDKLDLAKTQILNALEHRNDNPSAIPSRELAKLIYGPGSVYARDPTPEQISSITVEDARAFLARWQRPDAAVLGIVGDFDPRQMQQLVEGSLGGWAAPSGEPSPPTLPSPPLPDQGPISGRIFLVDIPGATQTSVAVGEPGIQMLDRDEYPLEVLGSIFNGFGGRLFNEIRSREGLAYSVSGGWAPTPLDHPGLFAASAETAQPAALLSALRGAFQQAGEAPPTAQELQRAKQEALNKFVFNFASRTAQLNRIITFDLLGIPQDYLFRYRAGIERVQPDDVLAAAQRRLHPRSQTIVVAGDAARLRAELGSALGLPVEDLRLDRPLV